MAQPTQKAARGLLVRLIVKMTSQLESLQKMLSIRKEVTFMFVRLIRMEFYEFLNNQFIGGIGNAKD